ncbi:MAG: hypothetical protein AABW79_04320 [Nanoarchaeota archaeon]
MILLDSSFIVSYYNTEDENHKKAEKIMQNIFAEEYGEPIIIEYVFVESINVLSTRLKNMDKGDVLPALKCGAS